MTEAHSPIFVVGCSRSGTTLLQSLLSSSSDIFAIPETNILYKVAGDLAYRRFGTLVGRRKLLRFRMLGAYNRLGLTSGFDWSELAGGPSHPLENSVRRRGLGRERSIRRAYRHFDEMMGDLAGARRWVEKSPQNIFVLDHIERHFPDAQFVHIVRSPSANIASLIDAGAKHKAFASRFGGGDAVAKAIRYYNSALRCSISRRHDQRHRVLRYETLVRNVDAHLRSLEDFLDLPTSSLKPLYDTEGIVQANEVWKQHSRAVGPVASKAEKVFTAEQMLRVEREALAPDNWFPVNR